MSLPKVILIVTIDVEEDNWGFYRSGITVENVRETVRLQDFFEHHGIKPTYLLSFQVALCDWAMNIFADIFARGGCEIGAHLHPWNTPPLRESLNEKNSMLINLPYELQLEKLTTLSNQIKKAFGINPHSFRAGRWGLGSKTIEALIDCGYRVDSSVTPMISWKNYGDGPEYKEVRIEPYWLGAESDRMKGNSHNVLLEVPVSIGFNRWPFEFWKKIYSLLQRNGLKHLHPIGLFHHTGLLRKIWLSPEGSSGNEMVTLSKLMISHGKRILNLTFHSNALLPGKGPFIKDKKDLERFYLNLQKFFEYLTSHTDLVPLTLSDVRQLFESRGGVDIDPPPLR